MNTETDGAKAMLEDIFAPAVVAVPPTFAARDMMRMKDGEIRHYGFKTIGGKNRRVYIFSRDNGISWNMALTHKNACVLYPSPISADWIGFRFADNSSAVLLLRSAIGPDDESPSVTNTGWTGLELRQLVFLKKRRRWLAAFSNVSCQNGECYHSAVAISDDDGRTWERIDIAPVEGIPEMLPGDARPRWFSDGCEPTVAEKEDGSVEMVVRTSGPTHYSYLSRDGGKTWEKPHAMEGFWAVNTMPYLFRLGDGRLLFFWNNTAILPTRDASEYPELSKDELGGRWESAFTNRDALHAAISEDDGKSWVGFREIILGECRNSADFKQLGAMQNQECDKSVHQTQAIELPGGKVLLALGQNSASRRLVIFDVRWLYESKRKENFATGLGSVSNHLYLKSLSGGMWERRGWSGHCAWNRMPGAVLLKEPEDCSTDGARRESLFLARIPDPRLVSDRQGVVWNFPAAKSGSAKITFRNYGDGFRLSLLDHWINPCDDFSAKASPVSAILAPPLPGPGLWQEAEVRWSEAGAAVLLDGETLFSFPKCKIPKYGFSYLHLQTAAEKADSRGTFIRELSFEAAP